MKIDDRSDTSLSSTNHEGVIAPVAGESSKRPAPMPDGLQPKRARTATGEVPVLPACFMVRVPNGNGSNRQVQLPGVGGANVVLRRSEQVRAIFAEPSRDGIAVEDQHAAVETALGEAQVMGNTSSVALVSSTEGNGEHAGRMLHEYELGSGSNARRLFVGHFEGNIELLAVKTPDIGTVTVNYAPPVSRRAASEAYQAKVLNRAEAKREAVGVLLDAPKGELDKRAYLRHLQSLDRGWSNEVMFEASEVDPKYRRHIRLRNPGYDNSVDALRFFIKESFAADTTKNTVFNTLVDRNETAPEMSRFSEATIGEAAGLGLDDVTQVQFNRKEYDKDTKLIDRFLNGSARPSAEVRRDLNLRISLNEIDRRIEKVLKSSELEIAARARAGKKEAGDRVDARHPSEDAGPSTWESA